MIIHGAIDKLTELFKKEFEIYLPSDDEVAEILSTSRRGEPTMQGVRYYPHLGKDRFKFAAMRIMDRVEQGLKEKKS